MTGTAAARGGSAGAGSRPLRVAGLVAVVRDHAWTLAIWVAMTVWAGALFIIVRDRHADFRLGRYDLGNMVQAVWSTAHGRPLEVTDGSTGDQVVRLGIHVDPILAVLAPLWIAVPSPLTLAALQVVAVALGALPVFWLARRHTESEPIAALVAFAYLAYPWIAWTALDAFHPVTLAIPLLLFCIWFLDTDRLALFALCAVLVVSTGELMGVTIAALGVWYALRRGHRVGGSVIAVLGVGWTLIALYVVVPAFSGGSSVFYGAFEDVGGSPVGLVRTALIDPGALLAAVGEGRDFAYIFLIAAPVAGAFMLAPALALAAFPQVLVNLVANEPGPTNPHEHYVAGILPFIFAAIAVGLARLSPQGRGRGAVLVLVTSVAATIAIGPWPRTLLGAAGWGPLPTTPEYVRTLDRAVALVPEDAPVSATNRVGSHLSARRYFYSVPVVRRAEWIVLETTDTWVPKSFSGSSEPEELGAFERRIERSAEWRKIFEEHGVLVFRKADA